MPLGPVWKYFLCAAKKWKGTHVLVVQEMQINHYAKYLGVVIGPDGPEHRWTAPRNKFLVVCARIRTSAQSLVVKLASDNIFAISVLTFVGSMAELDKETLTEEGKALQTLTASPFRALATDLSGRASLSNLASTLTALSSSVPQLLSCSFLVGYAGPWFRSHQSRERRRACSRGFAFPSADPH